VGNPSPTCAKCVADARLPQCRLANEFVTRHIAKNPTWVNSNVQKWGTPGCHIEMAKLFCPKLGDHTEAIRKTNFLTLDGTALFNMLSWYTPPAGQNGFPAGVPAAGGGGAAQRATEARNRWGHDGAAALSLNQDDFDYVFDRFENLLQILRVEANHTAAAAAPNPFTDALGKISLIKSTSYVVTNRDDLQQTVDRLAVAMLEMQDALKRHLEELQQQDANHRRELDDRLRDIADASEQQRAEWKRERDTLEMAIADRDREMVRRDEVRMQVVRERDEARDIKSWIDSHARVQGAFVPAASPFFAGRSAELEQLSQIMHRYSVGAIVALGGGGKTQLMLNYAESALLATTYPAGVWWVVGDTTEGLAGELAGVAASLGRHVAEGSRKNLGVAAAAAFDALVSQRRDGRWLVCVDNVDDPDVLNELAKVVIQSRVFAQGVKSAGRMLVTSRLHDNGAWHNLGVCTSADKDSDIASALLELGPLVGVESEMMLYRRRFGMSSNSVSMADVKAQIAKLPDPEIQALRDLAGAEHEFSLGGLPLALQQAGTYMSTNDVSFVDYLNLFKTQFEKRETESALPPAPDLGGAQGSDEAATLSRRKIHTTWELNVAGLPPKALRVLYAAALFAPDGIHKELLVALVERCEGDAHPGLDGVAASSGDVGPRDWDAARMLEFNNVVRRQLVNGASLLSASKHSDAFSMHRMVRMFVSERADKDDTARMECTFADAVWALCAVSQRHCGGLHTKWYLRTTAELKLAQQLGPHMTGVSFCFREPFHLTEQTRELFIGFMELTSSELDNVNGSLWSIPATDALSDDLKSTIAADARRFGADCESVRSQKVKLAAKEIKRDAFYAAAGLAEELLACNEKAEANGSTLWWCESAVGHALRGCLLRREAESDEDMRLKAMGHFAAARAASQHVPVLDASSAEIDDLAYALLEVLSRSAVYHVKPNCRTVDHIIAADMLSECVALTRRLRSVGHVDVNRVQGAICECWGAHVVWGCSASDPRSVSLIHEFFLMVEDNEGTISALLRVVVAHCALSVVSLTQGLEVTCDH
jgi:hypothetical protein